MANFYYNRACLWVYHIRSTEKGGAFKMGLFARTQEDGHEQVVFFNDPAVGLKAIIAVHSTAAGPAIGGCRMWPYASEEEALEDVLRLSKGMTYKNISMGLAAGGAKAVIIGDPKRTRRRSS